MGSPILRSPGVSLAENRAAALRLLKVENQVAADVVAAYKSRIAAASHAWLRPLRPGDQGTGVAPAQPAQHSPWRRLARAPGPIEVLQPIQALAQARTDYLNAVLSYNRSQFRLYRAVGWPPLLNSPPPASPSQTSTPAVPIPQFHQAASLVPVPLTGPDAKLAGLPRICIGSASRRSGTTPRQGIKGRRHGLDRRARRRSREPASSACD